MYLERLPGMQAELKLLIADAVSIPMMKDEDRHNAITSWQQTAYGEVPAPKANPAILRMLGIGVHNATESG